MEIRSSRYYHYICIFALSLLAFFPVILDFETIGIFISLVIYFIVIRFWISVGRTFVFDEKGCSISFLFYSRHYNWEELNAQYIDNAQQRYGYRIPYDKTLLFLPPKYSIPKRMKIGTYSALVHPFCFIYIYPIDPNNNSNKPEYHIPAMYEVDKALISEIIMWSKGTENRTGNEGSTGDGLREPF